MFLQLRIFSKQISTARLHDESFFTSVVQLNFGITPSGLQRNTVKETAVETRDKIHHSSLRHLPFPPFIAWKFWQLFRQPTVSSSPLAEGRRKEEKGAEARRPGDFSGY